VTAVTFRPQSIDGETGRTLPLLVVDDPDSMLQRAVTSEPELPPGNPERSGNPAGRGSTHPQLNRRRLVLALASRQVGAASAYSLRSAELRLGS
jgi:hypothetical protein